MQIIDKDHVPENIINNKQLFFKTAYLLLADSQFSEDNISFFFEKYGKEDDFEEFKKQRNTIEFYFTDLKLKNQKIRNNDFLRSYIKELKTKNILKTNLSVTTRILVLFIADIILDVAIVTHQDVFKEDYLSYFTESMKPIHLKEEFETMILYILEQYVHGEKCKLNMKEYSKLASYRKLHALYIVAMSSQDEEKMKEYKQQICDVITQSSKKPVYNVKIVKEKKPDIYLKDETKLPFDIEKVRSSIPTVISSIPPYANMFSIGLEEEKYREGTVKKMRKLYQQYFHEDMQGFDDYLKDCYVLQDNYYEFKYIRQVCLTDLLLCRLAHFEKLKYYDSKWLALEYSKILETTKDYAIAFLKNLTYYIWHVPSLKERQKRLEGFEKMSEDIPACVKILEDFRERVESDEGKGVQFYKNYFQMTPLDSYYNYMIMPMLTQLEEGLVSKSVVEILNGDEDYNVKEMSQKLTCIYEKTSLDKQYQYIHEYAKLFIMSYVENPILIYYSPFTRLYKQLQDKCFTSLPLYHSTLASANYRLYELVEKEEKNNKVIENQLAHFRELCLNHQDQLSLPKLETLELILNTKLRSMMMFCELEQIDTLFETHSSQFELFLSVNNHAKKFFHKTFEEQVDFFLCVCCIYQWMDEIDQYEKYMPTLQSQKHNEYVEKLNLQIDDLKKTIESKNQELEKLRSLLHVHTFKDKEKIQKIIEKEVKSYKQDISLLHKTLADKDKEIAIFKQNQRELFKLRELIFEMSEECYEEMISSVDLKPIIEGKNIVIIGGHIHLRERLKQKYPSLKILNELTNVYDGLLINADYVFMFYKFMTHTMYNKAISVLSKNNIPWDYISYTNLEKCEEVIYDVLKRENI